MTLDNILLVIRIFITTCDKFSVDIDITYIPIKNREKSFNEINKHLNSLKQQIERTIPGIRVIHRTNV